MTKVEIKSMNRFQRYAVAVLARYKVEGVELTGNWISVNGARIMTFAEVDHMVALLDLDICRGT